MITSIYSRFMLILLLASITSCSLFRSQPQLSSGVEQQLQSLREYIKRSQFKEAQQLLAGMQDHRLSPLERAQKYNHWGLLDFAMKDYGKARQRFLMVLGMEVADEVFEQQVFLNLASCDYRSQWYDQSLERLKSMNLTLLTQSDQQKVYLLLSLNAQKLNKKEEQYAALLALHYHLNSKPALIGSKFWSSLENLRPTVSAAARGQVLEEQLTRGYLGLALPASAQFLINLELTELVRQLKEQQQLAKGKEWEQKIGTLLQKLSPAAAVASVIPFPSETATATKESGAWQTQKIGVLLPMSGEKAEFARQVIRGLTLANQQFNAKFQFIIRDTQESKTKVIQQVSELIQQEGVSLVIGGLFPSTAQVEFEQVRSYGTPFIALSPITTATELKGPLLFELSGSYESIVQFLTSTPVTQYLGQQFSTLTPKDDAGDVLSALFWSHSLQAKKPDQLGELHLGKESEEREAPLMVNRSQYPKGLSDYRDYVQDLLGLKFARERAEEYALWNDIRYVQLRGDMSRAQVLNAWSKMNWVYLHSNPNDALPLLGAFQYLEAKNLKFVGGPSWRSGLLAQNQRAFGELYFVDRAAKDQDEKVGQYFFEKFAQSAKYLELQGFDGAQLAIQLLQEGKIRERSAWLPFLEELEEVQTLLTHWRLASVGVLKQGDRLLGSSKAWVKQLSLYKIAAQGALLVPLK